MATVREYFDMDFGYALKVHARVPFDSSVEAAILYDFAGHNAFFACYVPGDNRDLQYYVLLLRSLSFGVTQLTLDGKIRLPAVRDFPGGIGVKNVLGPFSVQAQFYADPDLISSNDIPTNKRVFIYAESDLTEVEVLKLKAEGRLSGHDVQFRSRRHAFERAKFENPLAFISHDSRDDEIAREIAARLQGMGCPVWYDRFSLNVGDNLRDSIERGLRECHKCIIVLSDNFFSNGGWTKKEFDSIFTQEILEERRLILPVWHAVKKTDVFNYSPSLLNVKGIEWAAGVDEVCRQLFRAIELAREPRGKSHQG